MTAPNYTARRELGEQTEMATSSVNKNVSGI